MNENIWELFDFCHNEVPKIVLEEQITKLVELYSKLTPFKDQEGVKEVYHANKSAILEIANHYITEFNTTPYSHGTFRSEE